MARGLNVRRDPRGAHCESGDVMVHAGQALWRGYGHNELIPKCPLRYGITDIGFAE